MHPTVSRQHEPAMQATCVSCSLIKTKTLKPIALHASITKDGTSICFDRLILKLKIYTDFAALKTINGRVIHPTLLFSMSKFTLKEWKIMSEELKDQNCSYTPDLFKPYMNLVDAVLRQQNFPSIHRARAYSIGHCRRTRPALYFVCSYLYRFEREHDRSTGCTYK